METQEDENVKKKALTKGELKKRYETVLTNVCNVIHTHVYLPAKLMRNQKMRWQAHGLCEEIKKELREVESL